MWEVLSLGLYKITLNRPCLEGKIDRLESIRGRCGDSWIGVGSISIILLVDRRIEVDQEIKVEMCMDRNSAV